MAYTVQVEGKIISMIPRNRLHDERLNSDCLQVRSLPYAPYNKTPLIGGFLLSFFHPLFHLLLIHHSDIR